MRFDVLGPLVVTGADGHVAVPTGAPAVVTCWLVANANEQVSYGALASVLSDSTVAETTDERGAHQVVRGLQARLGDALVASTTHATIRVDAEDVDAIRFESLLDRAQTAADLDAALSLWRGDPYPELAGSLAALAVVGHLAERRLGALEDAFGLRLRGRADYALVADLRAEVTRSAERPRLWRQLALALYRTGRQVEALDILAARRREGDEADTTALYDAILRHDPDLDRGELGR